MSIWIPPITPRRCGGDLNLGITSHFHRLPIVLACSLLVFVALAGFKTTVPAVSAQTETDGRFDGWPVWSPDGSRIAFMSDRSGSVALWVMDSDGSNAAELLTITSSSITWAQEFSWSPDSRFIAVNSERSGNYDVWVVAADGSSASNLTAYHDGPDRGQMWSPDGQYIAYVAGSETGRSEVWLVEPTGSNPRKVTPDGNYEYSDISWSPDGHAISFSAFDVEKLQPAGLWLYKLDGSVLASVTSERFDTMPRWSPDGKTILMVNQDRGNQDLWLVAVDGANLTNLTSDNPHADLTPVWSPGGRSIAFSSVRNARSGVWVMQADGSHPVNLTADMYGISVTPLWSPDGTKIAFEFLSIQSGADQDPADIWVMNADGSNKVNLTGGE